MNDHEDLVSYALKLAAGTFLAGIAILILLAIMLRSGEPPLLIDDKPTAPIADGGGW